MGNDRVQRICVDMDEVMADTLAEHLRRYNQAFDEDVTIEDLAGKGLWEATPLDRQQQLRAFLDAEDFFEDLPIMPDAQPVRHIGFAATRRRDLMGRGITNIGVHQ